MKREALRECRPPSPRAGLSVYNTFKFSSLYIVRQTHKQTDMGEYINLAEV